MEAVKRSKNKRPTVVDLFCGAGGLSAGFELAGYETIGATDFWTPACESIKANHPDAHVVCEDIHALSVDSFAEGLRCSPDVVLGGPSCQGFSTSSGLSRNGRKEDDPRNSHFHDFVRFVQELNPKWIVMENVPGLLLYNRGAVAQKIVGEFKKIGFDVAPLILLAADFGVPQLRRRLFFIGNRTGSQIGFPSPTNGDPELWKDFSLPFAFLSRVGNKSAETSLPFHVMFDEACSDLPPLKEGQAFEAAEYPSAPTSDYQRWIRNGSDKLTLHIASKLSPTDRELIKLIQPGQNWRSLPEEIRDKRFGKIRSYDATTVLRRLVGDRPSYTITTKFNDATAGAFTHPHQNRTLTLREGARLQSFPDSYEFRGSSTEIRKQIGNAVPPLLARAIAAAILPDVSRDAGLKAVKPPANRLMVDPVSDLEDLIGLGRTGKEDAAQMRLF